VIYLTQWLCAARHCAFALAWDDTEHQPKQIEAEGHGYAERHGLRPECGICGGAIAPEHGRTRFQTMAEALPSLTKSQADQVATRLLLDAVGATKVRLLP
jgi:hypothetical protein